MSYANGISALYQFRGATFDTAFEGFIYGPAGAEGRLISISTVITIDTTGATSLVSVGIQADADAFGTHVVPIGVAEVSQNAMTRGVTETIPADTVVTVQQDGGATAGDGDILVLIEWFGGDAS